jgi:hypothetical protein
MGDGPGPRAWPFVLSPRIVSVYMYFYLKATAMKELKFFH